MITTLDMGTLKRIVDTDPLTYERSLLLELINNSLAFRALRAYLCPWQEKLGNHRADFAVPRYNTLYAALYYYWAIVGTNAVAPQAHRGMLEAIIVDWTNKGKISSEEGQILVRELAEDFYNPAMRPPPDFVHNIVGPMFSYWLDVRLARRISESIANEARNQILTPDVIKERWREVDKLRMPTQSNAVFAAPLLTAKLRLRGKVASGMIKVDEALGGGYGFGQATLVAGVNAGGKTVYSTQLAAQFASRKLKVAYVTTEQPPPELLARTASNALQVNYSHFTKRVDTNADVTQDREVDVIPQWIRDDPQYAERLHTLAQRLQYICFLDWSQGQGQSIASNLETDLDNLAGYGFEPDVLILDWIGGGLDKGLAGKVDLRLVYQQAADWGVDYAKRKKKIVVEMAQLDRTKAMGKPKCGSAMLSECKTMGNNMTNFIGISALLESGGAEGSVFSRNQNFYIEKSRDGEGGTKPVERHFQFQRFLDKGLPGSLANHTVALERPTGVVNT